MEPNLMTAAFVAALLLSLATRLWLATRQMRHVTAHRGAVPAAFAASVPLEAHQRASSPPSSAPPPCWAGRCSAASTP
jgi:STE24 endopeptidase